MVPIWLYLAWRLERPLVNWRFALVCAAALAALFAAQALVVPEAWRRESSIGIIVFVVVLATSRHRPRTGTNHAEPSGLSQ